MSWEQLAREREELQQQIIAAVADIPERDRAFHLVLVWMPLDALRAVNLSILKAVEDRPLMQYMSVPVAERMQWQGRSHPHHPDIRCICCNNDRPLIPKTYPQAEAERPFKHPVRRKRK